MDCAFDEVAFDSVAFDVCEVTSSAGTVGAYWMVQPAPAVTDPDDEEALLLIMLAWMK